MKNIKLEICFCPKKKYQIHIGHCEWLNFKSKRFANNYLRKYKSLLTDNVRYLVTFQNEVNQLHKIFYFEYSPQTNFKIIKNLHNFDKRLPFIFEQYSEGNCNAFIFSTIEYCISSLIDTVDIIYSHSKSQKNYTLKNQCRSLLKILCDFENNFESDKRELNINFDYRNDIEISDSFLQKSS